MSGSILSASHSLQTSAQFGGDNPMEQRLADASTKIAYNGPRECILTAPQYGAMQRSIAVLAGAAVIEEVDSNSLVITAHVERSSFELRRFMSLCPYISCHVLLPPKQLEKLVESSGTFLKHAIVEPKHVLKAVPWDMAPASDVGERDEIGNGPAASLFLLRYNRYLRHFPLHPLVQVREVLVLDGVAHREEVQHDRILPVDLFRHPRR
ncbi:hypothetical protein B0H14DRAFT_2583297 [Mycena olivaceomarginata]|nr:hypothetical protein B0H14DRAFT_2583297 [Mycena olivaceomarginata]